MLISHGFHVSAQRRAVQDQRGAEAGEERGRDAEEADVKRADPEVEQVAADQRAAADPIFSLEAQQRHDISPLLVARQGIVRVKIGLIGWTHRHAHVLSDHAPLRPPVCPARRAT